MQLRSCVEARTRPTRGEQPLLLKLQHPRTVYTVYAAVEDDGCETVPLQHGLHVTHNSAVTTRRVCGAFTCFILPPRSSKLSPPSGASRRCALLLLVGVDKDVTEEEPFFFPVVVCVCINSAPTGDDAASTYTSGEEVGSAFGGFVCSSCAPARSDTFSCFFFFFFG